MTVDTDLATLRGICWRCGSKSSPETRSQERENWCNVCWDRVQQPPSSVNQHLARVETEIARLREERDAAREHSRDASEMYVQAYEQITELLQQQSFMERKLAAQREDIERLATRVETAEAEVERLRSDKDERDWRTLEIVTKQAEAAEARCARLQQALRHIDHWPFDVNKSSVDDLREIKDFAREALAGPDTPADSQEDGWFIPEGDRRCGVVHMDARATCMKRRGHGGSHGTAQGTWIDGPWCEYPADSQEDKT